MLVTAIVIPLLFLFFLFIVRKERKKQYQKWRDFGKIEEKTVESGIVQRIFSEKRKYYHELYVSRTELVIDNGVKVFQVIIEKPSDQKEATLEINQNDFVTCYGTWHNHSFLANRIRKTK